MDAETKARSSQAANGLAGASKLQPGSSRLGSMHVLEIQRGRLLAAMVEECVERGAANVSVAHVVGRAGVSRRTFYEIFDDREACFLAALDEGIERASGYVLGVYDQSAPWEERLRSGLVALLSFLDAERGLGSLLIVGSLGGGATALERRRCIFAQIVDVIDEGSQAAKRDVGPPPLTAEGIVGGVLSVLHSRLLDDPSAGILSTGEMRAESGRFVDLTGPLMSMIVLPYLGPVAARRELKRPTPRMSTPPAAAVSDPLRNLDMRLTYRTVRVLLAVAARPGGSNRQVADESGIGDQGQISKLLARLHGLGLIANAGSPAMRGVPNSWVLTDRGWEVQAALSAR